jgi:hypothetical protein
MQSTNHLVLVDFDGVVLKNTKASKYVGARVSEYMKKVTGVRDSQLIDILNKELYTSHGHTLLGLKKHNFTSPQVNYKCFNKFLYGDRTSYMDLHLTEEEKANWNKFTWEMKENNVKVRLFSNAGTEWMTHFIGYDEELFQLHEWATHYQFLKPHKEIYDLITTMYPYSTYHFIDDKVANFQYTQSNPNWYNLWMYNHPISFPVKLHDNFHCVSSLNDASYLIMKNKKQAMV